MKQENNVVVDVFVSAVRRIIAFCETRARVKHEFRTNSFDISIKMNAFIAIVFIPTTILVLFAKTTRGCVSVNNISVSLRKKF